MTYAELSEAQAMRSRQFAEAQTDAMSVYCDAERDLKELQAENAKLREQGARLFDKTLELGTENAELRELCGDMMRYYFMPSAIDSKQREMELIERANKLGVEEDDGELGVEVDG
jgi:hypothetical protein